MKLSKASVYGVVAARYIACHGSDGPVHGRAIADAHQIPQEYLLKTLQLLVRARILTSEIGRRGGFLLARPTDEITLLHIIEAIDGPIDGVCAPSHLADVGGSLAERIADAARQIDALTRDVLGAVTLHSLVDHPLPAENDSRIHPPPMTISSA